MKEYFAVHFDDTDRPMGVLTGPFGTYEQVALACEAIRLLYPITHSVKPVGGDTLTNSFIIAYARAAIDR